ncbi:aspartate aminotransferase family protein [Pseudomonas boanensis]|uniref:aspartate aminotransferase family protein n=1 Tax=Metapseudomonas boanensis TaxID=2822138 RepID=UPI0035D3E123
MESENLLKRRQGVMGSESPMFYERPLNLVSGNDVWLIDVEGKRYLDGYNNVPCVGHGNPHVARAMYEQALTLNTHTRYLNDKIVNYAERLLQTFDAHLDGVMFTCTGSEANELALRIARHATGGTGVIVSTYNYHGNSSTLASLTTAMQASPEPFPLSAEAIPIPCMYHSEGLSEAQLLEAYLSKVVRAIDSMKARGVRLAAMLIDTVFANEGIPTLPEGYVERLAELVHEAGGLLIVDEVQSGFGRTGKHMWGHQGCGAKPDIVTMGKPMGNGFPLAALVTNLDLINSFGRNAMYFNTFGGSPVAAAVGMAVLEEIENRKLMENVLRTSETLGQGLRELAAQYSIIGDVRNRGMFFAVELVSDQRTLQPAAAEAKRLINWLRENGVLISRIGPGDNVLKIRPPLTFDSSHADYLLRALENGLRKL